MYCALGVPAVIGGSHATFCRNEARENADAPVTGEAESVWARVLADARSHRLSRVYKGGLSSMDAIPTARHDLLNGSDCSFCSGTAFNGGTFPHRPVADVIRELRLIYKKVIPFVDDNLIGTRSDHLEYSKDLFQAMIPEGLPRPWICQATVNFGDDDELLQNGRDFRESVRRVRQHGMRVVGSFIVRDRLILVDRGADLYCAESQLLLGELPDHQFARMLGVTAGYHQADHVVVVPPGEESHQQQLRFIVSGQARNNVGGRNRIGTRIFSLPLNGPRDVLKILSLWNQQGSQVLHGQTLVLPVGNTFLYVEPRELFSQGNAPKPGRNWTPLCREFGSRRRSQEQIA
jgi:hypothetical protein